MDMWLPRWPAWCSQHRSASDIVGFLYGFCQVSIRDFRGLRGLNGLSGVRVGTFGLRCPNTLSLPYAGTMSDGW